MGVIIVGCANHSGFSVLVFERSGGDSHDFNQVVGLLPTHKIGYRMFIIFPLFVQKSPSVNEWFG